MTREQGSLGRLEKEASKVLEGDLEGPLRLTLKVYHAVIDSLNAFPEKLVKDLSQAEKVCITLLLRLANDLRCASLLASKGYALQAASLVSSAFEVGYTIAFIGSNESLAQEWIDHDDPKVPFRPVKHMIQDVTDRLGLSKAKDKVSQEYKVYRQLCLAKHANPLMQTLHGHRFDSETIQAELGPSLSDEAARVSWFALVHSTAITELALSSFVSNHVPEKQATSVVEILERVKRCREELRDEAVHRWGTEDPFVDKW